MAMSAEEKLKITVSLVSNVEPAERAIMESVRRLAADTGAAFTRIGESASSTLRRMAEDARAVNLPFARLRGLSGEIGGGLREIGEATGLARLREQLGATHESAHRLHEGLSGLVPAAAGVGFFLSLREGAEAMRKSAEYAEQLSITSKATGLSVTEFGGFQYAAKIAGIDPNVANRAIEYLNLNLGELQAGRASKDVRQVFGQLGVTPGMDTGVVLARLEDQLHTLTAGGHFAVASRVAGSILGVALLPLLGQGSAELSAQAARAAHFGLAPTDAMAETGEKFNQSLKDMDAAVGGLQLTISTKLFPVLSSVIEATSEWIARNREWIATNIADEVKGLANAARSIDWSAIAAGARGLGDAAIFATGHLKLIEVGLGAIALIKLAGVAKDLYGIGSAAVTAAARLMALPVAGLISSFATLVPAIGGVRDAFAAMSLAASANPLGAAIVAAGALAGTAYEVYEHWGSIKAFFEGVWGDVVASFQWGESEIKAIVAKIDGYLPTMPAWLSQAAGWAEHLGGVVTHEMALPGPGGTLAAHTAGGALGTPLHQTPASVLSTPIRRSGTAAGTPAAAKVQVTSRVIIDHHNPPPGTTTTVSQPAPVDVNLGNAWAW